MKRKLRHLIRFFLVILLAVCFACDDKDVPRGKSVRHSPHGIHYKR